MPVRRRLLLVFIPLLLLGLGSVWLLSEYLLLKRFDQLDAQVLQDNSGRLQRQLVQNQRTMLYTNRDWAWWQQTITYIEQPTPDFVTENLGEGSLKLLELNFILFYNRKGELVGQRWYLPKSAQWLDLNGNIKPVDKTLLKQNTLQQITAHQLNQTSPKQALSRIQWLSIDDQPLLIANTDIALDKGKGPPMGKVVMGYYLTQEWLDKQQEQMALPTHIRLTAPPAELPVNGQWLMDLAKSPAWLGARQLSQTQQSQLLLLTDNHKQPVVGFTLERPRLIFEEGQKVLTLFLASTLVVLILLSLAGFWALERWLLARLQRLHVFVEQIGTDGLSRVDLSGQDELGRLADAINQMLERLSQSEERDRSILANIQDGFFEMDADARVIANNPAMERMLGYPTGALLGLPAAKMLDQSDAERAWQLMQLALQGDGQFTFSAPLRRRDGSIGHFEGRFSVIRDSQGTVCGYRGIARDVSAQVARHNQLMELAYHDHLTGLGNRKAFLEQLQQALDECAQHENTLALFYIDLDRFKEVNDRFGHEVGDQLLIAIAARMKTTLRQPDRLYRLGGDEFTLLMASGTRSTAPKLAQRLLDALSKPIELPSVTIDFVTPSIGIAFYPSQAKDAAGLIQCADSAMYVAKEQRNRFAIYQEGS